MDAYKAATLLCGRHDRSAASRAYYAAYAAVTHRLRQAPGITLDHGDNNPRHDKLPNYVFSSFGSLGYSAQTIKNVVGALRSLRRDRIRADYMPSEDIDTERAKNNLRDAEYIARELGLPL